MEVISIDGTEYVRAAAIAKRFKYTSDYIGQLCRGGKVDAKLVGRTWYVNPISLEDHKSSRYDKSSLSGQNDKVLNNNTQKSLSRQNVESVLRKETVRGLSHQDRAAGEARFLKRIVWQPAKYEPDTSELLPPLRAVREPARLPVEIAESTKVKIKDSSLTAILETETLPEVSLSGDLKVSSLDDVYDDSPENIALTDIFGPEEVMINHAPLKTAEPVKRIVVSPLVKSTKLESKSVIEPAKLSKPDKYAYSVDINTKEAKLSIKVPSFAPDRTRRSSKLEVLPPTEGVVPRPFLKQLLVLLIVILGIALSVAILGIEQVVEISQTDYLTSYKFNFSLLETWENLRP